MTTGTINGLDPDDLSFTANSVFANLGDSGPNGAIGFTSGSSIRLDIVFVPEPTTILLLGLGGLVLRKCRK